MNSSRRPIQACLYLSGAGQASVEVAWSARILNRSAVRLPNADVASCGHLVAANAVADDQDRLEIADVIYRGDLAESGRASPRPGQTLARYPGCTVAATASRHGAAIAVRTGELVVLEGPVGADPSAVAVVCGSFIYGWLTAGYVVRQLVPGALRIIGGLHSGQAFTRDRCPGPLSFGMVVLVRWTAGNGAPGLMRFCGAGGGRHPLRARQRASKS